jgi:Heparinase II/III-like protein.
MNNYYKSCHKFVILFFVLTLFYVSGNAQNLSGNDHFAHFPVYQNMSIPKPEGLPDFTASDFKVDQSRLLRLFPDGFLYGDRQALEKLCSFLQNETDGISIWEKAATKTAEVLNIWDLDKRNFDRYVYRIPQLEDLALFYLFSGHKELGQFIRGHVLQITELPFDFWMHAELHGYNPDFPIGHLETSALCSAITVSLAAAKDLFSEAERTGIESALKEKGLIPCANWFITTSNVNNNFVAVIGSAAYHTAKYLRDKEREDLAMNRLVSYVESSIESDGSYGEGVGYFDYPIRQMFFAFLAMEPEERSTNMANTGLKYSASWKAYPLLLTTKNDRKLSLHYGDNGFYTTIDSNVAAILSGVYRDPTTLWLMKWFGRTFDLKGMLLLFSEKSPLPEMKDPGQLGLPLVKSFKAGDSYIRSTWEKDGIVLSMWSGDGSLIKFSHQRPELGSICMGAYGEYLIVSAGSASYRSDLHYQWDFTTKAANTITIDDKNQLFTDRVLEAWNKTDVSDFWVTGTPKAEILQCKSGEIADLLVNEMALAYHVPMKYVRRSVLFVKDPGYFIVIDKIEAKEDAHKFSWRVYLNNRDEKGELERKSPNRWFFSRPFADLDIHLFSDQEIVIREEKGYMHGHDRDYSPGGPNEGTLGSSKGLVAHNVQKTKSMVYYSVLFPTKKGTTAFKVGYNNNVITVGGDKITLKDGECTISQKKKTEKYKLWE